MAEPIVSARNPLRYLVDLEVGTLEVRELEGSEGLNRPFRFDAVVRLADEHGLIFPENIIGRVAFVRLVRDAALIRRLRAVVTEVDVRAVIGGAPELRLVLEPSLAPCRHRVDMRIFRNLTVPAIVEQVLTDAHVPFEMRLEGAYAERPYCLQFRESDLDFVHRLLEQEGIFYFFRDDLDGDYNQDATTLVLGDNADAYEELHDEVRLPFRPAKALNRAGEVIYELGRRAELGPSQFTLRDFNPDKPSLDMQVSAPGPTAAGVEYYDYPGKYLTPEEGARIAALMGEAARLEHDAAFGRSDCGRLAPGTTFALEDGPQDTPDGTYVVTRLTHTWRRAAAPFTNAFEAVDAAVVFRPARVTPRPTVVNPLTGFVTGPAGEDIYTDAMGRVKVHFPWDRVRLEDEEASHWIPVLQDDTGHSCAIPRIGWEVLVHFLEGDPDRPVVLGRVYNGADPFPEPLPEGKTRTALKSLTSPSRGGSNFIRIDDATGSELMHLQAEKDQNVVVVNDKTENVLNTERHEIYGEESIAVGSNSDVVVGVDRKLLVHGDHSLSVGASRERSVAADETVDVMQNRAITIGGVHYRRIAQYDTVTAGSLMELVGGLCLEASLKPNETSAGYAMSLTVGGALLEASVKNKSESCTQLRLETIGGLLYSGALQTLTIESEISRTTSVGAALTVQGDKGLQLSAGTDFSATTLATATAEAGTSITLKVGSTHVSLSDGQIDIHATGTITIQAAGSGTFGSSVAELNPHLP